MYLAHKRLGAHSQMGDDNEHSGKRRDQNLPLEIQQIMDRILEEEPLQSTAMDVDCPYVAISSKQWQHAFSSIFSFCEGDSDNSNSRDLYKYTYDRLVAYANNLLSPLFDTVVTAGNTKDLLNRYCLAWQIYLKSLRYLHSLLNHLNNNFVKTMGLTTSTVIYDEQTCIKEGLIDIYCMGLLIWKEKLGKCMQTIKSALTIGLSMVREKSDSSMMSLLREVYVGIQVLDTHLSNNFIDYNETLRNALILSVFVEFSKEHYKQIGSVLKTYENDVKKLMDIVIANLEEEKSIFHHFCPDIWESISNEFFAKIVKPHLSIFQAHIHKAVSANETADMRALFCLLSPLNECGELFLALKNKFLDEIQSRLKLIPNVSYIEVKEHFFNALRDSYHSIFDFVSDKFPEFSKELVLQMDQAFVLAINAWNTKKSSSSSFSGQSSFNAPPPDTASISSALLLEKQTNRLHPAILLVQYLHDGLKRPTTAHENLTENLNLAVKFVEYLEEKDVFVRSYLVQFNRRLLLDFPAGDDLELHLLSRLHPVLTSCDLGSRLYRMIKDYRALKEVNETFYTSLMSNGPSVSGSDADTDVEMSDVSKKDKSCGTDDVTEDKACGSGGAIAGPMSNEKCSVLLQEYDFKICLVTSCMWSLKSDSHHYDPPPSCKILLSKFEEHYNFSYPHRRLQWMHTFSSVTIHYNVMRESHTYTTLKLTLSAASAFILEYFDFMRADKISLSVLTNYLCPDNGSDTTSTATSRLDSADSDNLPPFMLALNPLLKCRILLCENGFVTINKDLAVSEKSLDLRTSYLSSPEQKMKRGESATIMADRRFFLECCIMRLMKLQRKVSHDVLVMKVQEHAQIRFQPTIRDIKEVIGHLIERGFLRRATDNMDMYEYIN